MQEALFPSCRESPLPFIANAAFGSVDSDDCDADRIAPTALELGSLVPKIVDHSVNLLDHRFCQNLYFNSDFNGGDGTSSHNEAGIETRCLSGYNLAEGSIAAPGSYPSSPILEVDNPVTLCHCGNEF